MRRSVLAVAVAMLVLGTAVVARAEGTVVSATSAARAAPAAGRLPLESCLLEAARKPVGGDPEAVVAKLPLATVVSLEAGRQEMKGRWINGARRTGKSPTLDDIVAGKVALKAPAPDQGAKLILAGPVMNSGEAWMPEELWVDAEHHWITVVAGGWTDNGDRAANMPGRDLYLLNVGKLSAGIWHLRVSVATMFRDEQKGQPLYTLKGLKEATTDLVVDSGDKAMRPVVAAGDLRDGAVPMFRKHWQYPNWGWEMVEDGAVIDPETVRVGNFDGHDEKAVRAFLKPGPGLTHGQEEDRTRAEVAGGQAAYAVVVGPMLTSGEWMTLGEAVWQGDTLTLKVELWRDTGDRFKNIVRRPLVIVPVEAGKSAGYKVAVEWASYVAPEPGGIYVPDEKAGRTPAAMSVKVTVAAGEKK